MTTLLIVVFTVAAALFGFVVGMLTVALFSWKHSVRVAQLEQANARLLGDVATACELNVDLERRLHAAKEESDKWRVEAVS